MTLRQFAIPLLGIAVLAGTFLLGYLIGSFQSEGLSPNAALLEQIKSAPLSWGYALGSGLLFVSFLVSLPGQLPVWRLYLTFRHIDSASLDEDPDLCLRFYRTALAFRCRYGENRFIQRILLHYNFFYEFHNEALHWMNDLVSRSRAAQIPNNMILDVICTGQIGRVFCGLCYGGGLPSAFVSLNQPVFLHARVNQLDVWSASSNRPICSLDRDTLTLVTGQHHSKYVSMTLFGNDKSSRKLRQLELRLPEEAHVDQEGTQVQTTENILSLQNWLDALIPVDSHRLQDNYGIDVAEIQTPTPTTSDKAAATPLVAQLQQMLGSHIDGIFSHSSLTLAVPDINQSSVVLCSGIGIITITDVPLPGTIYYSGDTDWIQINDKKSQSIANACLVAQRSKVALVNHLVEWDLNRWPVQSLVVFSHPDVQLELELGRYQIQCDVTSLGQLPKWFVSQTTDNSIRFTKDDYNMMITLLDPARVLSKDDELLTRDTTHLQQSF